MRKEREWRRRCEGWRSRRVICRRRSQASQGGRKERTQWWPIKIWKGGEKEESDELIWCDQKRSKVKKTGRGKHWGDTWLCWMWSEKTCKIRGRKRHANYARKELVSGRKKDPTQTQSRSPKWCKGQRIKKMERRKRGIRLNIGWGQKCGEPRQHTLPSVDKAEVEMKLMDLGLGLSGWSEEGENVRKGRGPSVEWTERANDEQRLERRRMKKAELAPSFLRFGCVGSTKKSPPSLCLPGCGCECACLCVHTCVRAFVCVSLTLWGEKKRAKLGKSTAKAGEREEKEQIDRIDCNRLIASELGWWSRKGREWLRKRKARTWGKARTKSINRSIDWLQIAWNGSNRIPNWNCCCYRCFRVENEIEGADEPTLIKLDEIKMQ